MYNQMSLAHAFRVYPPAPPKSTDPVNARRLKPAPGNLPFKEKPRKWAIYPLGLLTNFSFFKKLFVVCYLGLSFKFNVLRFRSLVIRGLNFASPRPRKKT